jgi:hypothetical protein
MAHDNCDECGRDYDFSPERDVMQIFLKNPECDHVLAICPHCSGTTRIYVIPQVVVGLIEQLKLPIRIFADTPPEIMRMVAELLEIDMAEGPASQPEEDTVWLNRQAPSDEPETELPEPPRDWLMSLYDDLRHLGGECGGCLWHPKDA